MLSSLAFRVIPYVGSAIQILYSVSEKLGENMSDYYILLVQNKRYRVWRESPTLCQKLNVGLLDRDLSKE